MKTIQLPESLDLYQLINLIADALCPIETDDAEGIGYQLTRIDVEKEVTQAARDGLLPLRHPMTLAPLSFHPAAVMLAEDLTPYLAARNLKAAANESPPPTMPQSAIHQVNSVNGSKRQSWKDVATAYIVEVIEDGQYATAKELYRALEDKAGPNSPFEKGTGHNRGMLFVREIAQTLSLKTVQNEWKRLRALANR